MQPAEQYRIFKCVRRQDAGTSNRTRALLQAAALGRSFARDRRVFGYNTLDEPQGASDWAMDLYHTHKAEDPDNPVLLNLGCDGWAVIYSASSLATVALECSLVTQLD